MRLCPDLFEECRLVRADGELDLMTIAPFAYALRGECAVAGRPFLIVDLSAVSFMDGSVLDPLFAGWSDCADRDGWLRVVYRPGIGLVFRAAKVDDQFPRYTDRHHAWRGLAA